MENFNEDLDREEFVDSAISLLVNGLLKQTLEFMHQYDIVIVSTINGLTPDREHNSLIILKLLIVCSKNKIYGH